MADIDNLNFVRAQKAQDNRLVAPLEVLRQVTADIEAGRALKGGDAPNQALVILLRSVDEDYQFTTYRANISTTQSIAILDIVKGQLVSRFQD